MLCYNECKISDFGGEMEIMDFWQAYEAFYQELGKSRKMVLSTSLDDVVTSRTMSVIVLDQKLYFQTDRTFRKYRQLKGNANVSLCADDIQVEGYCEETGHPLENRAFCDAYQTWFPASYSRYTSLENERLFAVMPTMIQRWRYKEGVPYIECFDVKNERYSCKRYDGV